MKLYKSKSVFKKIPRLIKFSDVENLMGPIDWFAFLKQNKIAAFDSSYGLHVGCSPLLKNISLCEICYILTR